MKSITQLIFGLVLTTFLVIMNIASAKAQSGELSETVSPPDRSAERDAIIDLFQKRQKSFNERNLRAQMALVHDDIRFVTAVGQWAVSGKDEYGALMLYAWDTYFSDAKLTEEVQNIDFVSDDVAAVQVRLSINPSDKFTYDQITGLRVVVKEDGKWLFRSSAHVPIRREPPMTEQQFNEQIDSRKERAKSILSSRE